MKATSIRKAGALRARYEAGGFPRRFPKGTTPVRLSAKTAKKIAVCAKSMDRWVDTQRNKSGWASYRPEDVPKSVCKVTNAQRGALEQYRFQNHKVGDRYGGYLAQTATGRTLITTWMGGLLVKIDKATTHATNAFGGRGKRTTFSGQGIDGRRWCGTSPGVGMFARMRVCKG